MFLLYQKRPKITGLGIILLIFEKKEHQAVFFVF